MDRRGRLEFVRDLSAEGAASDSGGRAAGRQAIFQRGSEYDGLVHSGAADGGEGIVMRHYVLTALLMVGGAAAANAAAANEADQSRRGRVDGIDLITYRTDVKDVVVIMGSLPAGDAMAGSGNIAVPTLTGMMLDRGTKSLDKFAIAE